MKRIIFFILVIFIGCKKETQSFFNINDYKNLKNAERFRDIGNQDSAYVYYIKAKEDLLKIHDNTEAARAITNIAIIESDKGDYHESIASSIEAEKLLSQKKDSNSKGISSSNYNCIAISSKNLKNFDDAIHYYQLALSYSTTKVDSLKYYNNIGDSYLEQKNVNAAKLYFKKALKTPDITDYARALNNLAKANFLENETYEAFPELDQALKIRVRQKDNPGINSSLATIADYYMKKDKNKALFYAKEMYTVAGKNKSPDDRLEALHKIMILDPENSPENFKRYVSLRDSLQTYRDNSIKRLSLLKYDVEKEKTKTQQVKAESAEKILKQYIILGILAAALVILLIIIIWYKKRQKILKQEKELEVKNTLIAMSKKVHDVVANGLYYAMAEIENLQKIDKERILNKLEILYNKSRHLSYDHIATENHDHFREKIKDLLDAFQNENRKVFIGGNDQSVWEGLSGSKKEDVFQIVQELIVNMDKHSRASQVTFRFEKIQDEICIFYYDNGIGIKNGIDPKNGLRNTENRTNSLNGKITFDTQTETGLEITISFPVS
ncbi:Tfp pilus assembly protein PilF [Chryseobacterium defluvii]|uniref:Tfp pilus assembly protein PilF n=1 Tax=Chryseobacterium defluvii TaxID=160396 RepID=A0A840KDT2_9FLAO|nr:tetratricopeptide repeat-containing sensor histidine kinase [Chryseobacterium defluvii]MBB4807326.1 Tfp pilus assembly protein PilF [Chryseobacterium defluvii]